MPWTFLCSDLTRQFPLEIGDIIEGCKRKNIKAQELLYKMYCAKMKKVCLRYADNVEDAKDIHQEGFIKIFENIKGLQTVAFVETWMVRVFINTAYEHYRKKKKHDFVFQSEKIEDEGSSFSEEEDSTYSILVDQLSASEIMDIVNSIPYPYHLVFKLFYFDGIGHKEISELLNLKENNCRIILHRAKGMLKDILETKISKMSIDQRK